MIPGLYKAKSDATRVNKTPVPKAVSMSNDERISKKLFIKEKEIQFRYKGKSTKDIMKSNPILKAT